MRRIISTMVIGSMIALGLLTNIAFAADKADKADSTKDTIKPVLTLKSIEAVRTTEAHDEVYFAIAELYTRGDNAFFTIPELPKHWSSKYLDKVKDVDIWDGKLKNKQAVEVIISVVEHDGSDINPDDLLGAIKLVLRNQDGKLLVSWDVPSRYGKHIKQSSNKNPQQFTFTGDGGEYNVELKLNAPNAKIVNSFVKGKSEIKQ